MPIHSIIVWSCFFALTIVLNYYNKDLKYLPSGPLQKMFADHWLRVQPSQFGAGRWRKVFKRKKKQNKTGTDILLDVFSLIKRSCTALLENLRTNK